MRTILFFILTVVVTLNTFAKIEDSHKGIWPVTDKTKMKSLNGLWSLKVISGIDEGNREIPDADNSWGTIPVPGNWEQYGFSKPVYSFPDSVTGYYRTAFTVPKEWKGQRVCLRLDGVLRGYDLWLNSKQVGTWELPYNTCIFDLTPFLTEKAFEGEAQHLAMRVYSHYKGYEFDCFDDWAPMGIFRDVTLFTVPETHLGDLTVTSGIDGAVSVKTSITNPTRHSTVDYEILDDDGKIVSTGEKIASPILWTPETPYLYTLRLNLREKGKILQTFEQKIGLRELSIQNGNVLTLNGRPVKFRGVTTHATDPVSVKVISDGLTKKDLEMMKKANINYIRTSHYPREPRFFELCDSMGFYVMCEIPFGSRGEKHLNDSSYIDNLLTRALATVTRHKNYPSVVIWSLGNENPFTKICQGLGNYTKGLDPTRLICYPQKGGFKNVRYATFPNVADIYAPHYPNVKVIEERFRPADRPVILTEYCHSLGTSFEDHDKMWEIIERYPNMTGGSVWEWVDQGMPFREHRQDRYGYEERVFTSQEGGFEMNGNKGTDGILYADRTPLPNYYELQRNYAQAFVEESSLMYHRTAAGVNLSMDIVNRYDFQNLHDNIFFEWWVTSNRDTIASGVMSPDCPARSITRIWLPISSMPAESLNILNFDIRDVSGRCLLSQAFLLESSVPDEVTPKSIDFNSSLISDPMIRVGRKATLAETMRLKDRRITRYLQTMTHPYVKGEITLQGDSVKYTLTPCDSVEHYLTEVGVAYLLDPSIDRVQWIGYGPFASYPGRQRANRYGYWEKHKDDLYFEGNRMGIDRCWLSDKDGNGVLLSGNNLNLSFEQTDRGIVVTVNALVSGLGPKFNNTPYLISSETISPISGCFKIQETHSGKIPKLFRNPDSIPEPLTPFFTQYDTYLMRFSDITSDNF